MKRKWILILLVIILICLFIWWFNTFTIKTTVTEIVSDKIKNEIKIVQISDLHGSTFGKDNNKLIRKIEKENPDFICVTGDMYTAGDEKGKQVAKNLIVTLAEKYDVYFVNGEHDSSEEFMNELKANNVKVLDYKKETIEIKDTKLNLYGITN